MSTNAISPTGIVSLPLTQIVADPDQPRRDWRHDRGYQRLDELTASIAEFGILQPLLVRKIAPLPDGTPQYMLITGARRRIAAQRAGLTTVPVVLRDETNERLRITQLIENLQRQDLSPLDEARAYQELIDLGAQTPGAVAAVVHVSSQQVRDRLRLLANQRLSDAVERRQIASSVAREIIKLDDMTAAPLYARLEAGEPLQMTAIIQARAAAAAAGLTHPRRKGGRKVEPAMQLHESQATLEPKERQTPVTADHHDAAPASGERPLTMSYPVSSPDVTPAPNQHGKERQEAAQAPATTVPAGTPDVAPTRATVARRLRWPERPHDESGISHDNPGPDHDQPGASPTIEPPPISISSGVHARVVTLLQRPEAAALRSELRALLRLPDATTAVMAAITAGVAEPHVHSHRHSALRHRM